MRRALLLLALLAPFPLTAQLLDHRALLERQTFWDNRDWAWYQANIPFFDSPDAEINATYYYRWELVTKHLTYGSPESGYTFTEFIDRPFWSGAFGGISCPLGHQLYEVRWLRDGRIVGDFARYWFETPGAEPRSYSNWYGDGVFAAFQVSGDKAFLGAMLPHMEQQHAGWVAERWDSTARMFHWDGMHDGMETNINSRLTKDQFAGADGYRPTINAYLYADEVAISRAAAILGQPDKARDYAAKAADLKARVQRQLWDPKREFFFHQFRTDEQGGITAGSLTYQSGPHAGSPHGRELIGYVPWQFNLPDNGYEAAWKFLMDTAYFAAPFGPLTVERHDPQFLISKTCCVWSGNAWPYATTQTLVAMANLLNNYRQSVVTKADYFSLLRTYTLSQRKDGKPYIAEAANPDNGSWDGHNTFDHSEHYFHSGYTDLIITGLVGLRPRADDSLEVMPLAPDHWDYFALDNIRYHGHDVAIVWDRDGTRYRRGAGLTLLVDGQVVGRNPRMARTVGRMPTVRTGAAGRAPTPNIVARAKTSTNVAVNNGRREYPSITTSYTAPGSSPHHLNDGNYWYHATPPNRWTTAGSPNARDTITVDFGAPRQVQELALYFLDDSIGAKPPASYRIEAWRDGRWGPVAMPRNLVPPTGRQANRTRLIGTTTSRLRVIVTPRAGSAVGITELEAWSNTPLPLTVPTVPSRNLAWGAAASASFTSTFDSLSELNDMVVAFNHYGRNRWTAFGTPNATDWIQFDFAAPRRVGTVELFLWGDNRGVKAPKRVTVQYWDGAEWRDAMIHAQVPMTSQVRAVNTLTIMPVTTSRIRIRFTHDAPAATGVTEVRILEAGR